MSLASLVGILSARSFLGFWQLKKWNSLRQRSRLRVSLLCFIFILTLFGSSRSVFAQDETTGQENSVEFSALSEDEQRQVQVAERFLTVLERSPRRGTALDRVYGHHVEFGSLDEFLAKLRKRVEDKPTDGVGWMLLGMFEAQRGEDANAVDAFRKAEEQRPDDAMPSYYLGQSLLLIGQPEEAVLAFERATDRKPRRADMLEIFRQLGRVHQRAQREEDAMQVWERLESIFPDDPRVQEQIAVTLVEEGEYKLALPRYEKLATMVKDDYRRTVFQIEAAELKIRDGEKEKGLADFEKLLANLNPTGWLHRDVRRRIEEVYLRTGDQDGLVQYYESWVEQNKEDVGAMARLAKFLASAARVPEATNWMEKALKLAPTRTDLRKAFIDQLVDDQRYAEASKQYEQLVKAAPANQDFLRDWGRLVMRDKTVDLEKRKADAAKIWQQIIAARPDDALTNAQVADLYRQSNIEDKAIELYKKAVAIAPQDPQYREYLGEYYHILKRPEEAHATWKEIASGERRTALNLARLAEVYNSFGYLDEAVVEIAAACELDNKDFALHLKSADYHSRASKYDEALTFVDRAGELAANDEETEGTLNQRIEIYQSNRRLEEETDKLAKTLSDDSSVDEWHTLARYYEADRRWADATEAVDKALTKDPSSILALTASARISELAGDYAAAARTNRKLAEVDRRSRSDHLMNVARLLAQLGKTDEALQAGKDLIVSAPGNTDNYEFYAQLCSQLGKMEEGLDALRKAVRINPTEPALIMSLGSALSREFRTDEAIEVYWRAFEKSEEIDDKTNLTQKLTELYLQLNQFDKLIERFERDRREDSKRREMTICLAQAHHSASDYGTARMELESLLSENTRDTNLLQQLSKLCEQEADLETAVEYQRQLASIAPSHETEYRLANLLQRNGNDEAASEIYIRLTRREENPARLLRSIDSLLKQSSYESVLAITEPLLSEQRDDWELLYREAVAWASMEKNAEAKIRLERLLALNLPHDKLGVDAEEKFKRAQTKAKSNNLRGMQTQAPTRQSPLDMLGNSYQIRNAVGLDNNNYYGGSSGLPNVWMPDAFGRARMAAYGWLLKFEQNADFSNEAEKEDAGKATEEEKPPTLAESLAIAANAEGATRNEIYDYMYVEQLQNNMDKLHEMARRLAKDGGKEERRYFLGTLQSRHINSESQNQYRSSNSKPQKDPLSDEDLELVLECAAQLSDEADPNKHAGGGQVLMSGGRMYIMIAGTYHPMDEMSGFAIGIVAEELKLAGREKEADELLQNHVAKMEKSQELAGAMGMFFNQEKYDEIPQLFERWLPAALDEIAKAPINQGSSRSRSRNRTLAQSQVQPATSAAYTLMRWMGKIGADEENEQVLDITNRVLDVVVAEAKKRRAGKSKRRSRSRSNTSFRGGSNFQIFYGKENVYARLDYPSANEYVNNGALMLLRETYEIFSRNEVLEDLPKLLRERVAKAKTDKSPDQLYEQLMLGYVLWWTEEKEEAVELLADAAKMLPDDPMFQLEMANLYLLIEDPDAALEVVEAIAPRDQKLVQQREIMALQLAERLGDIDRARSAAERLFGLRLDTKTQLGLVDQMRRLGMLELAEAIVARVQRRSGGQTNSLPQLMALYQGQGKTELAEQIAHTLLRRTKPPMSTMSASGRNPFRYRNSNGGNRTQALQLLNQTGALKDVIARLETQLERSPDSMRAYEQLIEAYQMSGKRDKVQGLLEKAIENRPDSIVMRFQLAKQLEQTGKTKEACDQYLELIKKKPSWIADDLYQVRRTFERAKRSVDLVKAFDDINIKSIGRPYYVVDLVTNLMRGRGGDSSEENKQIALGLFERVFEAFPSYRSQMISQLRDAELWKNPRIFELGKRGVVPSKTQAAANPWFGIDQIYSYSSGGKVNAMFHQMLGGIKGSDRVGELRQAIRDGLEKTPDWHGGKTMLALIDLQENKKEEAKKQLEELFADEKRIKTLPGQAGWIVGQELDKFEDTRQLAEKLFIHATKDQNNGMNQIEYSPIVRLIDVYDKNGRKDDARDLMLKQLKKTNNRGYDDEYYTAMQLGNTGWVADKLLALGYPVDALKLYRELSEATPEMLERASMYGNSRNLPGKAKTGVDKALASLNETNAGEAMDELLKAPEGAKAETAVLDVMLKVPTVQTLKKDSMDSQLMSLLDTIAIQDQVANGIETRLNELRKKHPADLSVAMVQAMFVLNRESVNEGKTDGKDTEQLKELLSVISDNPLDEIAEGRRANSRQRRQAMQFVPLWIVARKCLETEEHREIGQQIAEQAIAGARRQLKNDHAVAILYDWGNRSIKAGDRETAEAKWSELLDLVTKRPVRKKKKQPVPGTRPVAPPKRTGSLQKIRGKALALGVFDYDPVALLGLVNPQVTLFAAPQFAPASPARPAAPGAATPQPRGNNRVPPLTVSQFRTTIEIALAAAKNDMAALSQKAIKKSLEGGIPVPDANPGGGNSSGTVALFAASAMPMSVSSANAQGGGGPIETEVATSLRKVLRIWEKNQAVYPAGDVYELLHPLVFPASRPAEIMMYADSANVRNGECKSLGVSLVRWAKNADKLDDLGKRIAERASKPTAKVPGLVLQTHIALASDDLEQATVKLKELSEDIKKRPMQPMIQLACHAAIPAAEKKPCEGAAYDVLRFAVQQEYAQSKPNSNTTLSKLATMVNGYLARTGDDEAVSKFFDDYLVSRQPHYARYSGDYGQYQQQRDMAKIAEEAAKVGASDVALDFLGRTRDTTIPRYGQPSVKTAITVVVRDLSSLPAKERYEHWYDWTMPKEKRQSIRFAADIGTPVEAPDALLDDKLRAWKAKRQDFACNFTELAQAAQEINKLPELIEETKKLHEEKMAGAEILLPMLLVYNDDTEAAKPLVDELVKTMTERMKRTNENRPDLWGDYALYRACMTQSKAASELYFHGRHQLRKQGRALFGNNVLPRLATDYAQSEVAHNDLETDLGRTGANLKHWHAVATRSKRDNGTHSWWAAQEGQVLHLAGPCLFEFLYLRYPLTGDFAFHVDCYNGNYSESDAGFGGVFVESQLYGSSMAVKTFGGHDWYSKGEPYRRDQEMFGTVKIDVQDGKLKHWLNNHLVHEDTLPETSPWLFLYTQGPRLTSFRNLRITGNPMIPREVRLISDDSMDAWNTEFFNETQPRPRLMAAAPLEENDENTRRQGEEPVEYDWQVIDGVLTGNPRPDSSETQQSWTYYNRPLLEDEQVTYQFFHDPATEAHPTIGRTAILLKPDGVKLHFLSDDWDDATAKVATDNEFTLPNNVQGEVKLKANNWNEVKVARAAGSVTVSLNGVDVYEQPAEDFVDRRFGFFRTKRTKTMVRDIVLSGDWPENLDEAKADLLAKRDPQSPGVSHMINRLVTDKYMAKGTRDVSQSAKKMSDEEAYTYLKNWVLPSDTHESIRIVFDLSHDSTGSALEQEYDCPTTELLDVAERLGKLDEVQKTVDGLEIKGPVTARIKTAMQGLVALRQEDLERATELLKSSYAIINEGLPDYFDARDRGVEFILAFEASQFPETQTIARDFGHRLLDRERDKRTSDHFGRLVEAFSWRLEHALAAEPASEELTQWRGVVSQDPRSRGLGYRPSKWIYNRGMLRHVPGQEWTQLFYQSPLRGKFEIQTELSTINSQEVAVAYGMYFMQPDSGQSHVRVTRIPGKHLRRGSQTNVPRWKDKIADFRIVVDGNKIQTHVNGVEIHEEQLKGEPDPWIVLQQMYPDWRGMVNNLRISGSPEIPDEIKLLETADLAGWRADDYRESISVDGEEDNSAVWSLMGEELQARISKNRSAANRESLLRYRRPMLEDGEIEFEAFYDPEKVESHPAIGRMAFLIRKDGVKLHQLTDAEWDMSGTLQSDNEKVVSDKAVDLKTDDWNKYRLKLVGDTLTIYVNDKEVWKQEVAVQPNDRFFGLFRYADKNRSRIRNVVYRGDWPKQLPKIEEQELAYPPGGPVQIAANAVDKELTVELNQNQDKLTKAGVERRGNGQFETENKGTRIKHRETDQHTNWPTLTMKVPSEGDFSMTVAFSELEIKPSKEGWGNRFSLNAYLEDAANTHIEMGVGMTNKGKWYAKAKRRYKLTDGEYESGDSHQLSLEFTEGRLRIVRDGGSFHCLIAKPEGDFRLLRTFSAGLKPVREVAVHSKSSDKVGEVNVLVSNFSLITEKTNDKISVSKSVDTKSLTAVE